MTFAECIVDFPIVDITDRTYFPLSCWLYISLVYRENYRAWLLPLTKKYTDKLKIIDDKFGDIEII
jgi:hypothetical protein